MKSSLEDGSYKCLLDHMAWKKNILIFNNNAESVHKTEKNQKALYFLAMNCKEFDDLSSNDVTRDWERITGNDYTSYKTSFLGIFFVHSLYVQLWNSIHFLIQVFSLIQK